jgi:predicted dehydrogenase
VVRDLRAHALALRLARRSFVVVVPRRAQGRRERAECRQRGEQRCVSLVHGSPTIAAQGGAGPYAARRICARESAGVARGRSASGMRVPMTDTNRRRLRIGVLGAGQIAQAAHLEACRKAANAELHALCDAAADLLEPVAAAHRPRVTYTDYDRMLADPDVDAVVVAVADRFHVPMARRALNAGKHVLVEKPMGVDVAECEALAAAVAESGLVLQVGTMRRFDPNVAYARDFIAEQIGEVLAMRAWYCDSAYRYEMTDALQPVILASGASARPRGDPKADRRRYYLLGHASHLVDTARFLCGDIVSVRAQLAEKYEAFSWFVSTEFAGGSIGHLDLTIAVRMDWFEGFHVYGEHGSVVARAFQPWYLRAAEVECFADRDRTYHRPLGADGHVFRRQIEGFAATILDGAPQTGAGAEDGVAVARVLAAIERSLSTGDTVEVAGLAGAGG